MAAYDRRVFVGGAADTTLSGAIASGATSIPITDATGWPTTGDFFVVIDRGEVAEEKVRIASRTSTTLTVQTSGRGSDGTTAAAHAAGASITPCVTAFDLDEANLAVNKTIGKVTAAGDTIYADGAASFARLAKGTSGQFYKQGATNPSWASLTSADMSDLAETIRDTVGATLVAGTNMTVTVNDGADTITLVSASAAAGISDFTEAVQDVVGALGLGGSGLTFTYNDGANTAVIDVNVDGSTLEINADTLRIKDGGVTTAKLAAAAVTTSELAAAIPRGTLGYTEKTTDQLGIGTGTTDLTSMASTVTVRSGSRVKITAQVTFQQKTTGGTPQLLIREGSTTLQQGQARIDIAGGTTTITVIWVGTPTAGSHTYKMSAKTDVNTIDTAAGVPNPMFILVEDIGA